MNELPEFSQNDLGLFLLVFFRIAGIMAMAPLFGGEGVPPKIRIMVSFILAILFYPLVPTAHMALAPNLGIYLVAVGAELAVGMILGFTAMLLFTAAQFAGQFVDQELGLSLANVIDPITNQQVSVVGQFKLFLGMIIWLLIFGHHFVILIIFESFSVVPLAGFTYSQETAMFVTDDMMRNMFMSAFRLASPAVVTLFVVTLAMAFMARVVPEMNLFILGFSLRILVGMLVLVLGVGLFADMFVVQSEQHEYYIRQLLELMRPK